VKNAFRKKESCGGPKALPPILGGYLRALRDLGGGGVEKEGGDAVIPMATQHTEGKRRKERGASSTPCTKSTSGHPVFGRKNARAVEKGKTETMAKEREKRTSDKEG